MYDFWIMYQHSRLPGGAAVGSLIACLIFGVVAFGLSKWVNRERQAPDTEQRIGRAQPR